MNDELIDVFNIPADARVPKPPTGAQYAAVCRLHRDEMAVGYALIIVRIWKSRERHKSSVTRLMPDALVVWTSRLPGQPEFEDGILVEETEPGGGLLQDSKLRWRGITYNVVWLPWNESEPIFAEYFE